MFIIRTAIWLGIVVMLVPSDPEAQKRLADTVRNGIAQVSTTCERQPAACQQASAAWTAFKAKAETVGRLAFNLAMEQMTPSPAAQPAASSLKPAAADVPRTRSQGTLREDDLIPQWRGDGPRGRI